jgi:hypothetical protein
MRSLTLILAALCLAIPAAHAQPPGMVITFLDKNGDGRCDLNEYLTFQVTRMTDADENSDGELTLSEFRESLQGRSKRNAQQIFNASNVEGGRTLSQKEFLGYHAFVFRTVVDGDKDGFMSAEELKAVTQSS